MNRDELHAAAVKRDLIAYEALGTLFSLLDMGEIDSAHRRRVQDMKSRYEELTTLLHTGATA